MEWVAERFYEVWNQFSKRIKEVGYGENGSFGLIVDSAGRLLGSDTKPFLVGYLFVRGCGRLCFAICDLLVLEGYAGL